MPTPLCPYPEEPASSHGLGCRLGAGGSGLGLWRGGAAAAVDEDPSPIWPFWIAVGAGLVGASWLSLVHAGGSSDVLMPAYAGRGLFAGLGYTHSSGPMPGTRHFSEPFSRS